MKPIGTGGLEHLQLTYPIYRRSPLIREALELPMRRHGDSYWHLHRAVVRVDEKLDHSTTCRVGAGLMVSLNILTNWIGIKAIAKLRYLLTRPE
nr:hypothetical protein [Brucella intermedia]